MPILSAIAVPHPPLIIPEVGNGNEAGIQSTVDAYYEASQFLVEQNPETIIIISPHADTYYDRFHISPGESATGSFKDYGVPQVVVSASYDNDIATKIVNAAKEKGIPIDMDKEKNPSLDHGTMIPLYFSQQLKPECKIVRVSFSGLTLEEHYEFGKCISKATLGKPVAIVGSGDLSHKLKADGPYGFVPQGPKLDKQITEIFAEGNLKKLMNIDFELIEFGAECGLRAFVIMAGALDNLQIKSELLSYEGPYGVGYGIATFLPTSKICIDDISGNNPSINNENKTNTTNNENKTSHTNNDEYVSLARFSIESFIGENKRAKIPASISEELTDKKAGVFVSLHKKNELRGCIGTIAPATNSIAEEIMQNAISAASRDPRFHPVTKDELPLLEIKVDVLGDAEEISSPSELDVKRYGVIVSNGHRRGLLLPDLEGVDTVDRQVSIARQKAGIGINETIKLERFEVIRHE